MCCEGLCPRWNLVHMADWVHVLYPLSSCTWGVVLLARATTHILGPGGSKTGWWHTVGSRDWRHYHVRSQTEVPEPKGALELNFQLEKQTWRALDGISGLKFQQLLSPYKSIICLGTPSNKGKSINYICYSRPLLLKNNGNKAKGQSSLGLWTSWGHLSTPHLVARNPGGFRVEETFRSL